MMTRRDLIAALTAVAAASEAYAAPAAAIANSAPTPIMGSSVFDWNSIPAKPTAYGTVRSFFSAPTATLKNLEVHVTTLNPGLMPHQPHRHPNEEMVIIQHGTVEVLSNGVWKRVGVGSVIFNGSNQLHGLKNVGAEPATYHVINFKSDSTPAGETTFGSR
ncbi:MAG: cupin domain-containing protein [Terracidiphilus sp.]|jgi:quercetin dioxygenase-like cupin family protein